jgi:nucleoside-diphosphate-sugar epimerase
MKQGHTVTVLLRQENTAWRLNDILPNVRIVLGGFGNFDHLVTELAAEPVDIVFHLAWTGVTADFRNNPEQITENVTGTLELWKILQNAGCKTFVSVGSQAEYGLHNGILSEKTTPIPKTVYGVSKLSLSMLLQQLCDLVGMRFVWLRLFSAYGPADDEAHMVPGLIRSLLRGEKPALTLGEQIWDYLYIDDIITALTTVMNDSNASGVYNLGSGSTCRLRDFISSVRDAIDPSLPLGFGDVPYRHDQVMHLEADISRLKNATGWQPTIDLAEGIRRTVDWYRIGAHDAK